MYAQAAKQAALDRHLWAVKRFHFVLTQCVFPADIEVACHAVAESHNDLGLSAVKLDGDRFRNLESRLRYEHEHEKCAVCGVELRRESGLIRGLFYQCSHGAAMVAPFQSSPLQVH